jgi:hypothetical protein
MTLEGIASRFAEFRCTLRESDRQAFDRVIGRARAHASAASCEAALDPTEVLFLSVVLDQEIALENLQRTLDELSWRTLGRPAASAKTLDACTASQEESPATGAPTPEPAPRPQRDRLTPAGRGWELSFKQDGRKSKAATPSDAPTYSRMADVGDPPSDSV